MQASEKPDMREMLGAALDWWREAGVDHDYADDPADWLAKPEAPAEVTAAASLFAPKSAIVTEPAKVDTPQLDSGLWPTDLEEFRAWWLSEPALDQGRTEGRVTSRGPVGAELMLVIPDPEPEDRDSLLSGPLGALAGRMLHAFGIAPDQVSVVSVLPRSMPMPDWQSLHAQGFGDLLTHQLQISAPKRVIIFGGSILPLLGHAPANSPALLTEISGKGWKSPLLATRELPLLRDRPRWKAALWSAWLDWGSQD